jgi:hypothetical protein
MEPFTITYITANRQVLRAQFTDLPTLPIETFRLSRRLVSKPRAGQRNVPIRGFYWFAQVRGLIAFESILEMRNLMLLDHREAISAVVAQPFMLSEVCNHFPDFWVRFRNGDQKLIDVKRAAKVNEPENVIKWEMTRDACALLGWEHEVRTELPSVLGDNLRFLSHYRTTYVDTTPYEEKLVRLCREAPRTIKFLLDNAGPSEEVRPVLYALLWRRRLVADLESAMIDHPTLVWEGSDVR